jgi:SAM-dependent methyltransferase
MIRKYINPAFEPASVVDFGCGVGRLLVHFSPVAREVVGLDVSPSMLEEAKRNCDEFGVSNVQLLLSDDQLSALSGRYDLIHSFIVFQHIPPERGRMIFRQMLPRISAGGVGALHFSYAKTCHAATYGVAPQSVPRAVSAWRAAGSIRKPGADPEMQMNPYHLNEILFILQTCRRAQVSCGVHGPWRRTGRFPFLSDLALTHGEHGSCSRSLSAKHSS